MDTNIRVALDAWVEWKKKCALKLCGATAQSYLYGYAAIRFQRHFERYAYTTNLADYSMPSMDKRHAWHLFESYLTIRKTRKGKRYKDWLFCRAGLSQAPALDTIQGGAFILMRDVVRDFLRTDYLPRGMLSMQQCMMGMGKRRGAAFALEEFLASDLKPSDDVALREYESIAEQHVCTLFCRMTRLEKIAILARRLELPLAHRGILSIAGCRKSKLARIHHDWMLKTAGTIKQLYPDDDEKSRLTLALIVVDKTGERVIAWAKQRRSFDGLFKMLRLRTSSPIRKVRNERKEAIA